MPTDPSAPLSPQGRLIVEAATQLFAEHGYDGVGTRQLAAAVGLNIATVHHHVGSKHALYERVLAELFAAERAMVSELADRARTIALDDPAAVRHLLCGYIDALVDFTAANPARPRLYTQLWLRERPGEPREDAVASLALYRALRRVLEQAVAAGAVRHAPDWGQFLRSFDYLIYGYFVAGPFDWKALRGDPLRARSLARFKEHLHAYACRMLGLPEVPRRGKDTTG